jgi:IclR family acetate operon transcriptional repressor
MAARPKAAKGTIVEMDSLSPQHAGSVQALDRGLTLLSIIGEADGLSLTNVAQRAGIAPSTAHRILATLKAAGFVHCDAAGGYFIGVKAFKVGSAFLRNRKLVDVGRRTIRRLMEATGETASIGIENDGYVIFISQMESHHSIRTFHRPGGRSPLHASSIGKAILAALPDEGVRKKLLGVGMPKFTANTIVDPEAFLANLAAARRRGWTIDDEERAEGMRCVGAAIYNEHAEVIGAISVSGPLVRMSDERLGELGPMVKRAAVEITNGVGGTTGEKNSN